MKTKMALLVSVSAGVFVLMSCGGGGGGSSSGSTSEPVIKTQLLTFDNHIFAGAGNCAVCHDGIITSQGEDVSIAKDWRATMMANSSKDPLWQAKIHTEMLRNPDYSQQIQNKCSRCHMPMANVEATHTNQPVDVFEFLENPNSNFHLLALDGVSCTVCHQIQDDPSLGTKESFTGGFKIDTNTQKPDRKIYGHYQDPFTRPMINDVGYTPTYSPHMEQSKLCATCHTLYTNPVNNPEVEFPEQVPYLEWEHSVFGDGIGDDDKSCQQCHMPQAEGTVKIAKGMFDRMLTARANFYKHYFVGGNVFMLNILKNNILELNLTADPVHFDRTIARTVDMLRSSAELVIDENQVSISNDILTVPVKIINKSGHKLPTGYPARRVWVHIAVKDANGNVVFESGKVEPSGKIIGNDADEGTGYEPHYDKITSQEQVQIYEAIMQDTDGNITYTLMNAATYKKDNRLLPQGFDKDTAPDDIKVVGLAENDNNFIGGEDTVVYEVNVNGYQAPFSVEAQLMYQSVAYGFYQDLLKDKEKSKYVARFEELYNQVENKGEIIDSVSISNIR